MPEALSILTHISLVLIKKLLPIMVINIFFYYLLTTEKSREKHNQIIRIIFFKIHKQDYLALAKQGSESFLNLMNRVFGEVEDDTKFFSKHFFSKQMITRTYWISFSYVYIFLIYCGYYLNEIRVGEFYFSGNIDWAIDLKYLHILFALFEIRWIIVIACAIVIFHSLNKATLSFRFVLCTVFIFFSYEWIRREGGQFAGFESPLYISMQFLVNGSARFNALIGNIILITMVGICVYVLGIWSGTLTCVITFFIVSSRDLLKIAITEGIRSGNFTFWFDRIVGSATRGSIAFLSPIPNLLTDMFSINVSRYLFYRLKRIKRWRGFLVIVLADIIFAFFAFVSTPLLLLLMLYFVDMLGIWNFSSLPLHTTFLYDIIRLFRGTERIRTWWVIVMFLTTVIPSILHLSFVLFEMSLKFIEPIVRIFGYKGHYLLMEKSSNNKTLLRIAFSGGNRSAIVIALLISFIEFLLLLIIQQAML